nr:hypothetical protein Iba_chr02cCG1390 [Ipomoea batatas]
MKTEILEGMDEDILILLVMVALMISLQLMVMEAMAVFRVAAAALDMEHMKAILLAVLDCLGQILHHGEKVMVTKVF